MPADRDDAACTVAVVRKPPMKETALGERGAVPRALIYRGLTLEPWQHRQPPPLFQLYSSWGPTP